MSKCKYCGGRGYVGDWGSYYGPEPCGCDDPDNEIDDADREPADWEIDAFEERTRKFFGRWRR